MNHFSKKLSIGILLCLALVLVSGATMAMDHSMFIQGPFKDGPAVTKKCLSCHQKQAKDVQHSIHFQWRGKTSNLKDNKDKQLGKRDDINGFCIGIASNEQRCSQCHAGYGMGTSNFSFEDKSKIDCLVCHADASKYKKAKKNWGKVAKGVDLVKAAQSVGKPKRNNCLNCHAYAGGGENVKAGDLGKKLTNASRSFDVHMGTDGANMNCQSCHTTKNHKIPGRSMQSLGSEGKVACSKCHTHQPHSSDDIDKYANVTLNEHTETIACQTCHIPTFSKGSKTKMEWDWSAAGSKDADSKKKGNFVKKKDVKPVYKWYNGQKESYLMGDKVSSEEATILSKPVGSIKDKNAKIYPFKEFISKQPMDAKNNYLLVPKLIGSYWKHYDWNKALTAGAKATDLDYSGEYKFTKTKTYIRVDHEVVPKENALSCGNCHLDGERINFKALGYEDDPMTHGGRELE